MNKEYEFIIHRHSLQSRFHFEDCEAITLTEKEFQLIFNVVYNTLDSENELCYLINKLKQFSSTTERSPSPRNFNSRTGYPLRPRPITLEASEPQGGASGSLLDKDGPNRLDP